MSSHPPPTIRAALAISLFGAFFAASPAAAQDCAAPLTQMDMNACARLDWQAQDAALNAAYARAIAAAEDHDRWVEGAEAALREAQRAWIAFRDLACRAETVPHESGSIAPTVLYMCLSRLTAARTADLRLYAATAGL
jgi:uncharacterized protein YecT (DUF1311 family)